MPRTDGPNVPARPKHISQFISLHRSSLSIDQSLSFFAMFASFPDFERASVAMSSLGRQFYPFAPRFALLYTLVRL